MTFYAAEEVPIEEMDQDESNQTSTMNEPLSHAKVLTDESPVRSTQQKGVGLSALKKSLSIFSSLSDLPVPDDMQSTEEDRKRAYNYMRQERLEKDTFTAALNRWRVEHSQAPSRGGVNSALQTKPIGALMWTWHEQLVPLIREEIRKSNEAEKAASAKPLGPELSHYGPYLQYLSPEKLSAVTIIYTLDKMAKVGVNRGTKITPLVMQIGKTVEEESAAETITNWYDRWLWRGAGDRKQRLRHLIKMQRNPKRNPMYPSATTETDAPARSIEKTQSDPVAYEPWPYTIQCRVGAILTSLLIQAAKMEVFHEDPTTGHVSSEVQPVFWTSHQFESGKRIGVIRMNTAMGEKMSKEPLGSALAKHLPMLTEPTPWTNHNRGGFLDQSLSVVRIGSNHKQSQAYIKAAANSGDLSQVFAALNVLGKTPWRINKQVFEVMLQVWNSGEAIADIPPENPTFDYPPEPSPSDDMITRTKYAYRLKEIEGRRDGLHSERCFLNFQMEVARAFLDETFYFPHNVDFRGRAYPVPPHLNHMRADNCRGLLLFGRGRELGEAGLRWLKVHLANVFGYDKASLQERCDFTTDHISDIYDSANNPMTGARWWLKAEDPWQCLAACIELKNALDSPDPMKFVSHLPVHQDGTCNGLQHYAALGGDAIGAKQVNLEPGDRPSDIYTAVADMVKKDIAEDAAKGDETAKFINGKITRKVVKPTVMTNVYGVTFTGARRQVLAQLEDIYPDIFKDDLVTASRVSSYVAVKIFTALSAMFNGAQEIQYWLGECASRICGALTPAQMQRIEDQAAGKDIPSPYAGRPVNETKNQDEQTRFKTSVIWTTPLKMPVVQPYRTPTCRTVQTNLQQVSLTEPTVADPVSKRKQLQGFPPNFIHSLDATHMLLSALKCNELGLTFAAVHDSFWTHAADVNTMNTVLRDAFIRMHSEDIIGRLAAEFTARYQGCMYLALVQYHSALGQKIHALRAKTRTASKTQHKIKIDELLVERTRLRLLASDDPAERAKGEAMITPASLFAAHANDSDLVSVADTDALAGAIGSMAEPAPSADDSADAKAEAEADIDGEDEAVPEIPSLGTTNRLDRANMAFEQVEKNLSPAEKAEAKRLARNRLAAARKKVWLWLPLTFPEVPKKVCFLSFSFFLLFGCGRVGKWLMGNLLGEFRCQEVEG